MPEHVHLLVSEPEIGLLAEALQSLKQGVARQLALRAAEPFWQPRYYDFNVWSESKFLEKLRYIHRNPVHRGLVEHPEDWAWSSFRHYATGEIGPVEIESQWTARRRERTGIMLTLRTSKSPPYVAKCATLTWGTLGIRTSKSPPCLAGNARQGWGTRATKSLENPPHLTGCSPHSRLRWNIRCGTFARGLTTAAVGDHVHLLTLRAGTLYIRGAHAGPMTTAQADVTVLRPAKHATKLAAQHTIGTAYDPFRHFLRILLPLFISWAR